MVRFPCNGHIKIIIDSDMQTAKLEMQHDLLHIRPEKYNVSEEVKIFIRQQIHLVPKDIFSTLEFSHPELTQNRYTFGGHKPFKNNIKKMMTN